MSDLTKRAALFIAPDEYESRYIDTGLAFDPLSELEPVAKRPRTSERGFSPYYFSLFSGKSSLKIYVLVMLYVRKREESIFIPLHIVPPSISGLIQAVGEKFGVEGEKVIKNFKNLIF